MNMKKQRQVFFKRFVFLLVFFVFTGTLYAVDTALSVTDAAKKLNAAVAWDPFSQEFVFTAANHTIYCRIGQPLVFFDDSDIQITEEPYFKKGQPMLPPALFNQIQSFLAKNQQKDPLFRVGVILIDPGHGGKDPGAVGSYVENGKTIPVREKDIVLLHEGTCSGLKHVLNAAVPPVDFSEAAAFFDGESPSFSELTELLWDGGSPETAWAMWQALCESPYFICTNPAEPIIIRSEAEIAAIQEKQAQKEEAEQIRSEFIDVVRKCLQKKSILEEKSGYVPFFQEIEALALGTASASKLLKELKISQTPEDAHDVLLKTGFWSIERNPHPQRFGHSLHSSKIEIPTPVYPENPLDLSDIPAYAIDDVHSTDPDDAVSFDGTYLWVHIANPADTIQAGSRSDSDACGRGATLYTPEGAARMLGEQAVDAFALGLRPASYALSFRILLDENGEIADTAVFRTRLHVTRLTYGEADTQKSSPALAPLFEIAERNRRRRAAAGAVSIDFPEVSIRLEKQDGQKRVVIEPHCQTEAAAMIKEMMLLAGEAAARFAFKNAIPFQYISQETPELPNKLPDGLAGEYKKRRAMRQRSVGTVPSKHAALGLAMYGQVTSPLRRYGDLVSHRQLLNFLDGKPLTEASRLILDIAAGDEAARACVQAERVSRQHWTLVYLLQNPEWTGEAVVIDIQGKKVRVFIPELAYETDIGIKTEPELNDILTVKVQKIRLAHLQAHFVTV